ncbi:MAG TPA: LPS export ABC transporter periplasmic protein LptC [Pseudobacter sp.]|nr:LPS export ABC transporter periplasmic protein LptC [Pseudobacter sp.]
MSTYSLIRAALLLGCFFFLISCENTKKELDAVFGEKATGIEEATQVSSYMSQDGITKAHLTAPIMLRKESRDSAFIEFPKTLHVDFYDTLGVIETILDARYGKYRQYENKVLLRDSVRVINIKNGDTLRTPELWWDQNKQEFYTDKPSHITKRDGTDIFSKNGMKAKQDLTWYELYGNSGILPVPDDANPNLPADSLRTDSAAPAGRNMPPPPPPPAPVKTPPAAQPEAKPATPAATKPVSGAAPGFSGKPPFMRRTDSMRNERERRMGIIRGRRDEADRPAKQP